VVPIDTKGKNGDDVMKKTFRLIVPVFAVLLIFAAVFVTVQSADAVPDAVSNIVSDKTSNIGSVTGSAAVSGKAANTVPDAISETAEGTGAVPEKLTVHYLDVGQADSILIQSPSGKTMLIDAGNNGDSEFIKSYINKLKIQKIDVLIGTHPHEDHIGGMEAVIKAFRIGKIYMPKAAASTRTYKNLLTAVKNKNLKITSAVPGKIEFDDDLDVDILAPNSKNYEDLNDYSVVVKVTYNNTSFLFAGDAEKVSEEEMINKGYDLKADVLKVGHHGSKSGTSEEFLRAVSPEYAVISVGDNNDYGLPDETVLERLEAANVKIFRTDTGGTIVAESDGSTVTFGKKPASDGISSDDSKKTPSGEQADASGEKLSAGTQSSSGKATADGSDADRLVYYTRSGKSYHYSKDCPALSRSREIIQGKLSEAIKLGKADPCDRCVK